MVPVAVNDHESCFMLSLVQFFRSNAQSYNIDIDRFAALNECKSC